MSQNEVAPAPQVVRPEDLPVDVRLAALEQALRFTMSFIKVNVTHNSPIIGGGATQSQMTLMDFYLQQLQQQQMLVGQQGQGNGR